MALLASLRSAGTAVPPRPARRRCATLDVIVVLEAHRVHRRSAARSQWEPASPPRTECPAAAAAKE
eukprot:2975581-Alexandrium_andersonii.AAC.1